MSFIEFSKSPWLVYDFSSQEIQIFNRRKRLFCYLSLSFYIYWLLLNGFHAYYNSNTYRFYLSDFIVTLSDSQRLFDFSICFTHVAMIRMCIYMIHNDRHQNFSKFQWLEFLKIEDEQTLVKKHFFTTKEASNYLHQVRFFMKSLKINELIYAVSCLGVMARMLLLAYSHIPLQWFVLVTLPNVLSYLFMTISAFSIYNYFVLIYFSHAIFIKSSLQSLASQRSALPSDKLKKCKVMQLCRLYRQNLHQFNYILRNFKASQQNLNFTFSYSAGLCVICFSQPFNLLFNSPDISTFLLTGSLYIQVGNRIFDCLSYLSRLIKHRNSFAY